MLTHTTVLLAQIPGVDATPPPGAEKVTDIVGYLGWLTLRAIIGCFLAGIIAFTGGRVFDHHRTGKIGAAFLMAAVVGAILYAIGPTMLNTFAATPK